MSIIVLIYSILSVYNRFVCRHISAKFCQNSTDDGVAQSAKERITLTTLVSILSNETTTTTAMTTTTVSVLNLIENFKPSGQILIISIIRLKRWMICVLEKSFTSFWRPRLLKKAKFTPLPFVLLYIHFIFTGVFYAQNAISYPIQEC